MLFWPAPWDCPNWAAFGLLKAQVEQRGSRPRPFLDQLAVL
jgi:hypothetical protein